MLKYEEYILEKKLYELILESKIEFSKNFINILKTIKSPISDEILKLQGEDKNVTQNYLDVDLKEPDSVTFLQDNRAQRILDQYKDIWSITNNVKVLKFDSFSSDSSMNQNKKIYDLIGVDMSDVVKLENRTDVKLIKEIISESTGRTYCYVETISEPTKKMVINKEGLTHKSPDYQTLWTQSSRNTIGVGRIIRKLLQISGKSFSSSDIEKFVNDWKSSIDIMNNAFLKFDVVKGDDIHYWYKSKNTVMEGTLGNSCMIDKPTDCHYIYTENPDVVSMVVLYDDDGTILNGKYKSNRIQGRALLWKTNEGDIFMDKIYYVLDSQKELFKKFAESQGWWSKRENNGNCDFDVIKGEEIKSRVTYTVTLREWDWGFPYMDSLIYFNERSGVISNSDDNYTKEIQETWNHYYEDYQDDDN